MVVMFKIEALTTMKCARFELTAVLRKIQLFCEMTSCRLVNIYRQLQTFARKLLPSSSESMHRWTEQDGPKSR
jgi:hypothetical protein